MPRDKKSDEANNLLGLKVLAPLMSFNMFVLVVIAVMVEHADRIRRHPALADSGWVISDYLYLAFISVGLVVVNAFLYRKRSVQHDSFQLKN